MKLRTILLLIAALGLAGGTAALVQNWMAAERAAAQKALVPRPVATGVQVLVAKRDLPIGTFVKDEHLGWQAWPKDGVSENYIVNGRGDRKALIGAVVRNAVLTGQPVTAAHVVQPGDRGFMAAVLTPGRRAVSVPLNTVSGISGFVFPGDSVDVILTVPMPGKQSDGERRFASETLLNDVRVLAIDQSVASPDGKVIVAKSATLEVDPKQAEKIALALQIGTLSLSLRSLAHEYGEMFPSLDAVSAGGKPAALAEKSYTLDHDILFMHRTPTKGGGRSEQTVDVLRGDKVERVKF